MKTKIRTQIEDALEMDLTQRLFNDKRSGGKRRLKVVCSKEATRAQKKALLAIPGVIKVGYVDRNVSRNHFGITILVEKKLTELN